MSCPKWPTSAHWLQSRLKSWTPAAQKDFYARDQGSRLIPWAWISALKQANGQPFLSFEEFYANFQLSSLFRWAWTFDELSLKQPHVEVILDHEGNFNFANLLAQTNAAPKKEGKRGSIPHVLVFNLAITNGHVGFADLSRKTPFRTAYAPINLHLTRFTTKRDRTSPYSFEASSD